jgi:hypothetical protein
MKNILFFAFLALSVMSYCQTGINTYIPDQSARLDIYDTAKGLLIPRLTTNQMNNIQSPATGLMIFNSQTEIFWFKNSVKWIEMLSTVQTTGCSSTTPKNYDICIDSTGNKYTFYIFLNTVWTKL